MSGSGLDSSLDSSMLSVTGDGPVQETGCEGRTSEGRNVTETVVPSSAGIPITEKPVQGNFNGQFDKNYGEGSQVSFGDLVSVLQDSDPTPVSYSYALHKQEPLKRTRDWTDEDIASYKQQALQSEADASNAKAQVVKLKVEVRDLKLENTELHKANRDLDKANWTITILRNEVKELSSALHEVKQHGGGGGAHGNASDSLGYKLKK